MTFSQDIAAFAAKAQANMDRVVQGVAGELGAMLAASSVIGDAEMAQEGWDPDYKPGTFLHNWQVGINQDPRGFLDAQETNRGAKAAQLRSLTAQAKAGDRVWLSNNTPYIFNIEYEGYRWAESKRVTSYWSKKVLSTGTCRMTFMALKAKVQSIILNSVKGV